MNNKVRMNLILENEDLNEQSFNKFIETKYNKFIKEYSILMTEDNKSLIDYYGKIANFCKTLPIRQNFDISNMIKEESIKRNWYEKEMLTNGFESLIGSSEIPNNIFSYMNNFR